MRYIETFKDGDRISEVYLCKSKSSALTKAGKEYENVILIDKTGQIDSKIWDVNSGGICDFEVNDYVFVNGQVTSYNGALQFKIERIRVAAEDEYTPTDYIPSSTKNASKSCFMYGLSTLLTNPNNSSYICSISYLEDGI